MTGPEHASIDNPIQGWMLDRADGKPLRKVPEEGAPAQLFSEKQAAAIGLREREILVSAGAGAGKTSVLVERYLRLLYEDQTLDTRGILAITFTDKAAAQMRQRLRERLQELADRSPAGGTVEYSVRWRLEEAWIGTFHSIAGRLLRRFGLANGVDPDLAVLDQTRSSEVKRDVFDGALQRWLASPLGPETSPEDREFASDLAARVGIGQLQSQMTWLLDLKRSQGIDPGVGEEQVLATPPPLDATKQAREKLDAALEQAFVYCRDFQPASGKISAASQRDLDLTLDAIGLMRGELLTLQPHELPGGSFAWPKLPGRTTVPMKSEELATLREALDEAVCAFMEPAARRELRFLEALLIRFAGAYRRRKRTQGSMDFDDQLLQLLWLLRSRPDIAARLRGQFRYLLVDEFQDTNPVQAEIVALLSSPKARFQVGDKLQAIYGFRHATVAGFDQASHDAAKAGGNLQLDETYRCASELIEVINKVGGQAHDRYQPLVGGHSKPIADSRPEPRTEVHLLSEAAVIEPVEQPVNEITYIADLIAELVNQGRSPGQIAVLMRRRKNMPLLEQELLARGVGAVPGASASLLEQLEVQELSAWLAALANPHDDVALLGALRLPITGVDAPEFVRLLTLHRARREHARSTAGGSAEWSLWRTLEAASETEIGLDLLELRERLAVARAFRVLSPAKAIEQLLEDGQLRQAVLLRPSGGRRWNNVCAFVDWLHAQEQAGSSFQEILARAQNTEDGPSAPIVAQDDAVQIMTFHAAKGLEWPVVICGELGAQSKTDSPRLRVPMDPRDQRIGLAIGSGDNRAHFWDYKDLAEEAALSDARESRRLIHVAMTRAEERLILCGTWKAEKKAQDLTGALDAKQALSAQAHDQKPGAAAIRWLLPILAPANSWPNVDEQKLLNLEGSNTPVLLTVSDPINLWAQRGGPVTVKRLHQSPATDDQAATLPIGASSPQNLRIARLPDPLSYTRLEELLKLARSGDSWNGQTAPEVPLDEGDGAAQVAANVRGDIVHRLLEQRFAEPLPASGTQPLGTAELDAVASQVLGTAKLNQADRDQITKQVGALESSAPALAARAAKVRFLEREFLFELSPGLPLLTGFVDLWFEDQSGQTCIVDWKTNQIKDGQSPESIVADSYDVQRKVYALAALRSGVSQLSVTFVFAQDPQNPVVSVFGQQDRQSLETEIGAWIELAAEQI